MRSIAKRKNDDRRNPAGGIGEGTRTVRRGGWLKFGDDLFYSQRLADYAGERVWVHNLSDAFSPEDAYCLIDDGFDVRVLNIYHLACKGQLPKHLEFLRPRLGKLTTL